MKTALPQNFKVDQAVLQGGRRQARVVRVQWDERAPAGNPHFERDFILFELQLCEREAGAERGPEIKEDGGGAVFQEDLVAADRGGAVVDSDGDCQIQPSRLSATASRLT